MEEKKLFESLDLLFRFEKFFGLTLNKKYIKLCQVILYAAIIAWFSYKVLTNIQFSFFYAVYFINLVFIMVNIPVLFIYSNCLKRKSTLLWQKIEQILIFQHSQYRIVLDYYSLKVFCNILLFATGCLIAFPMIIEIFYTKTAPYHSTACLLISSISALYMECQVILLSHIFTILLKNINLLIDQNPYLIREIMKIHGELFDVGREMHVLFHFVVVRVVENFLSIAIVVYSISKYLNFFMSVKPSFFARLIVWIIRNCISILFITFCCERARTEVSKKKYWEIYQIYFSTR